ncbi:hypothetical protein FQR65_LT20463 [Abscondita terminalis]|nr:hypothetical protein FQR65_LT20463 [Abscondita terminalis]
MPPPTISESLYVSRDYVGDGVFSAGIEGPAVGPDGHLYLVNFGRDGTLGRVRTQADGSGHAELFLTLPAGSIGNGIRFAPDGAMYVADYPGHNILRITNDGHISVFAHQPRMHQPNDLARAPDGRLYASDPDWTHSSGQLWRIDPDGSTHLLESGMGTTNGIDVSPDGRHLYVNESLQRRVWAYDLDTQGRLSHKRLLITFPDHGLDGMRIDTHGNLYIARYGAGTIAIVSPQGQLLREVPLTGRKPTNLTFGGPDGRTVYVTLQDRGAVEMFRAPHPGREPGSWPCPDGDVAGGFNDDARGAQVVGLQVVQLVAVGQQAHRQVIQPQGLLQRGAGGVVVAQPVTGFVVEAVAGGAALLAVDLFATSVIGVVGGRCASALYQVEAACIVVEEGAVGADGGGVAGGVVAARYAGHGGQSMGGGRVGVARRARRGGVSGAVAGGVVGVGVQGRLGGAVAGLSEPAQGVVVVAQRRWAAAGEVSQLAGGIKGVAQVQAVPATVEGGRAVSGQGVGIADHQAHALGGLHLAHHMTQTVVAVLGVAAGIVDAAEASAGEGFIGGAQGWAGVVGVGSGEAGVRVAHLGQSVQGVVGVGGRDATGIGLGDAVARAVIGSGGGAGVGAMQLGQFAQAVVGIAWY